MKTISRTIALLLAAGCGSPADMAKEVGKNYKPPSQNDMDAIGKAFQPPKTKAPSPPDLCDGCTGGSDDPGTEHTSSATPEDGNYLPYPTSGGTSWQPVRSQIYVVGNQAACSWTPLYTDDDTDHWRGECTANNNMIADTYPLPHVNDIQAASLGSGPTLGIVRFRPADNTLTLPWMTNATQTIEIAARWLARGSAVQWVPEAMPSPTDKGACDDGTLYHRSPTQSYAFRAYLDNIRRDLTPERDGLDEVYRFNLDQVSPHYTAFGSFTLYLRAGGAQAAPFDECSNIYSSTQVRWDAETGKAVVRVRDGKVQEARIINPRMRSSLGWDTLSPATPVLKRDDVSTSADEWQMEIDVQP
jgi:hypothetical protein